jgi:hypothetical protein
MSAVARRSAPLRRSAGPAALASLCAACGAAGGGAEEAFVQDFAARAPTVVCEAVAVLPADGRPVRDLAPAGDSAFLVLHDAPREVLLYDGRYRQLRAVPIPRAGPGMVASPGSAALVGDTLLLVTDRATGRIQPFNLDGTPGTAFHLPFLPALIRSEGNRTWIAPAVIGGQPGELLFELLGDRTVPLGIHPAARADLAAGTLANALTLAAFPDGRAVLAHQFLEPRAYLVGASNRVRRVPLPLPAATRDGERAPALPLTPEALASIFTAALAASGEPRSGDLLYLARSGGHVGHHHEKALLRADRELRFQSAVRLAVNATRVVALPARDRALVTDELNRWYECPAPPPAQ